MTKQRLCVPRFFHASTGRTPNWAIIFEMNANKLEMNVLESCYLVEPSSLK